MKIKVTCPNDPRHLTFSVTAHISQIWKVDANAEYLEVIDASQEVTHSPDAGDLYSCLVCGTQAHAELVRS